MEPGEETPSRSFDAEQRPDLGHTIPRPEKIHRKPVPSALAKDRSENGTSQEQAEDRPAEGTTNRGSVSALEEQPPVLPLGSQAIARKPIGPRPQVAKLATPDLQQAGRKPVGGNPAKDSWSPRATLPESSRTSPDEAQPPALPPRPTPSMLPRDDEDDIHVTIIRRDPASGAQWNIGNLIRRRKRFDGTSDSVGVEIVTPGYRKFARSFNIQDFDSSQMERFIDSVRDPASMASTDATSPQTFSVPSPSKISPMTFSREIILPRHTSSRGRQIAHRHHRSNSSDTSLHLASPASPTSPTLQQQPFTFLSPWQGTCTFSTGMDGRSLKCRHRLPVTNPDVDTSVLAAELRFNLPWATALRSKDINRGTAAISSFGEEAKHGFKKGIARIRHEFNPSHQGQIPNNHRPQENRVDLKPDPTFDSDSDSGETSPPFDLALGREHAGGGIKGKSAKLGKLVLRDEGLKMADLVVAASIGVWWAVRDGIVKQ